MRRADSRKPAVGRPVSSSLCDVYASTPVLTVLSRLYSSFMPIDTVHERIRMPVNRGVSVLWFVFAIAFLFTSLFAIAVYAIFVVAKFADDFE